MGNAGGTLSGEGRQQQGMGKVVIFHPSPPHKVGEPISPDFEITTVFVAEQQWNLRKVSSPVNQGNIGSSELLSDTLQIKVDQMLKYLKLGSSYAVYHHKQK